MPPSSGVTRGENTGGPRGETGCPRWAPGRRGSGLLEAGRAGGGLTPHRVLPAEPRFLSAEWGGSRKLPPLGSCTTTHRVTCAEDRLVPLSSSGQAGRGGQDRQAQEARGGAAVPPTPPTPACACRVIGRAGSPRASTEGRKNGCTAPPPPGPHGTHSRGPTGSKKHHENGGKSPSEQKPPVGGPKRGGKGPGGCGEGLSLAPGTLPTAASPQV